MLLLGEIRAEAGTLAASRKGNVSVLGRIRLEMIWASRNTLRGRPPPIQHRQAVIGSLHLGETAQHVKRLVCLPQHHTRNRGHAKRINSMLQAYGGTNSPSIKDVEVSRSPQTGE